MLDEGQVLLIRTRTRKGRSVWTFPKGRGEPGEVWEETALREVLEETGYACRIRKALRMTSYQFYLGAARVRKNVRWFLMEPIEKAQRRSMQEVDEARWVPVREAYTKLSYVSDRKLLKVVEAETRPSKRGQGKQAPL